MRPELTTFLEQLRKSSTTFVKVAKPPVQRALRRAAAIAMRHKYATAVTCLAVMLIFWPKAVPSQRGASDEASRAAQGPAATRPATTQPATTQPVSDQYAGDIPLYAPDLPGADASWSLPAELKADDSKHLVADVDNLAKDFAETLRLQNEYHSQVLNVFNDQMLTLLWTRLTGKGFRDSNLPLDWYEVVKDYNSVFGAVAAGADEFLNALVQAAVSNRIGMVQVRLIGGKVLVGDVLFVKVTRQYVDARLPRYRKLVPVVQSLMQRMQKEFKPELDQLKRQQGG